MNELAQSATLSTKRRKRKHEDMEENELTGKKLLMQYHDQQGLCFYTGIPIINRRKTKDWQTSKERIEPKTGYTLSNTVLVAEEMNNQRQWTCEKVKSVSVFVNCEIDNTKLKKEIFNARHPVRLDSVSTGSWEKSNGMVHCGFCKLDFPKEAFTSQITNGCKSCQKIICLEQRRRMGGFIRGLINRANANTKARNLKGRNLDFNIKLEDILDLIERQNGRCAYSGIPLVFKSGLDWQCSIERIEDDKGYIIGNIKLVCLEFNTPKKWSKEKFIIILGCIKKKYELH